MTTVERYRGIGRGPRTRDGCSVDLYLRLPYLGEVELLQPLLPTMASVIELGCGVGRITRELLAHGYRVTAVDNSAEMLAHVPEQASKICADIEDLSVRETFDAVIFASCLINVPDVARRTAQLAKCRDLLKSDGRFILERYDPTWLSNVQVGVIGNIGNVQMHIIEAHHSESSVDLCLRYRENGEEWLHYFSAAILDDDSIRHCLSRAGFGPPSWIDRRWASARVVKRGEQSTEAQGYTAHERKRHES